MVGVTDHLIANPAFVDGTKGWAEIPLITAIQKGKLEIFDLLLRCGANVNAKDTTWGHE